MGNASARTGWSIAAQSFAALAAAMGVGRFVFTPVIPLMEAQAQLLPAQASAVATSNYLGYLVGAVLGIAIPALSRARLVARVGGAVLVASLVAMPFTHSVSGWVALRGIAGVASAIVFMVAGNTILSELATGSPHLVGWAYGGVGGGIAASGVLIAVIGALGDWRDAWWASALLTVALLACGWFIGERSAHGPGTDAAPAAPPAPAARHHRHFGALATSYFLEGAGYIVAGTFLVAAVKASAPGWLAGSVWTVVGLAAVPSAALWSWLGSRFSRPTVIIVALLLQAVGIALPALSGAVAADLAAAILFGATFVGITTMSLATGRYLRVPRAVAILTAGYAVGQVLGPIIVAPTLGGGYRDALLVGAALVLLAGIGAALLRVRFPHHIEVEA